MAALDPETLLDAYDAELRTAHETGAASARDGPLVRVAGYERGGMVVYRDLGGLDGGELDELIARQIRFFAARAEPFEWKLHAHDRPADLASRLLAAGFVPEPTETVLIAPVAAAAAEPRLPEGVRLREVHARSDLDRIEQLLGAVEGSEVAGIARDLETELAADPSALRIFVAEQADELVSSGWVRFVAGTRFASLWGGSTRPAWRRRGIYRALVAQRANLAAARGVDYLQVDASDASRPTLERLGFVAVTTTTPYIWTPGGS